ncbi:MAG: histidine phosphatase family protein [Pseudomonadota bacterium]
MAHGLRIADGVGKVLMTCVALVVGMASSIAPTFANDDAALWDRLRRGEVFVMMRHALAPGTGDPANFDVNDCSTQRNLSERGRGQAREIGDLFRANGIGSAQVVSSAWCRCQDTASELKLGPVETLDALNSFFENRDQAGPQTAALEAWLTARRANPTETAPLVLVTHQVNISGLVGSFTRSGEMVFIEQRADGGFAAVGSI